MADKLNSLNKESRDEIQGLINEYQNQLNAMKAAGKEGQELRDLEVEHRAQVIKKLAEQRKKGEFIEGTQKK